MSTHARTVAAVSAGLALALAALALPTPAQADTLVPSTFKVNFQATTSPTPSGYVGDAGQAYSATRGYGWTTGTGTPLDNTANGRQRNVSSDPLLDTLVQMQAASGTTTPGSWKAAVADGTYTVTVAVGDPSYTDSRHVLNVEGTRVVDFTPTSSTRQKVVTADVTVSDGFLDVNATGGTNTKIDYLQIAPRGSAGAPTLSVSSPEDVLGLGSRLVFSTVQNQYRAGHSLTLRNGGGSPLLVSGLTFGGAQATDFRPCVGQPTSFTVPAGGSAALCVRYTPQVDATTGSTVVSQGSLTIASNAADDPSWVVSLGGLSAINYEGDKEPSLQRIFTALGYGTDAAITHKPFWNAISGDSRAKGDEVLAPYFVRRDSSKPVQLVTLAQYSGKSSSNSASLGWYAKGSSTNNYLYAHPGGADGSNNGYGQNQLLVPSRTAAVNGANTTSFTPSGAFGLVDNLAYSNRSDDARNGGGWHNLRTYPAKTAGGTVIPGAYLVGNDVGAPTNNSAKNWDAQDYVMLLLNATPDAGSTQPTPGEYNRTLAGFDGTAGGVAGTGFTSAQGAVDTGKIAVAGGALKVTSSDDSNTSHTNALQLGVSSGTRFRIQSRFTGPFTALDAGAEQQAIYYGPNASNYLKAEIEWNATEKVRKLSIWRQQTSTGGALVASVPLPGGDTPRLDLRIDVDPSPQDSAHYNGAPLVVVSYALNGSSTFTRIGSGDLTIPATWVTANTPAGIMTSHQQGGAPFVATFASFGVSRLNG